METVASKRSDLADRSTPLIRNEWYIAALAEEVTRKPIRRTLLNEDIVLYRKEDGAPVAMQNRCLHRSYPLSEGRLEGDNIVCGYHGFQYGPDGQCAWVPALRMAPPSLRLQAYPVKEVGPFIWIWTGDAEAVDERRFIDQPWFREGWRWVAGYFHMQANYLGLHENLFDTSHFPFLHGNLIGKPEHAEVQPEVKVLDDDVVTLRILHRDVPAAPQLLAAAGIVGAVDRLSEGRVEGPAMHLGKVTYSGATDPSRTFSTYVVHCTTPESQAITHYYWAISRNIALDDEEVQAGSRTVATLAFDQDKVALEQIEALIARDQRPAFRERIIATDKGAVQVLRVFAKRAAQEQDQTRRAAE